MSSKVEAVFTALAESLHVEEHDFLTLVSHGNRTADELYFRMPSLPEFEKYLEDKVFPVITTKDDAGLTPAPRASGDEGWEKVDWMRGPAAASLRRLWEASKQLAKRDLEALTDEASSHVPKKVSPAVVADMAAKCLARGLPTFSATEAPGAKCLGRLLENFKTGGAWAHVPWECYTSREDEAYAARSRPTKKDSLKIVSKADGTLAGFTEEVLPRRPRVDETLALQEVLRTRAIAFEYLGLVQFELYEALHGLYLRKLRARQPERMRSPTLNEVRMCDRLIHEEVYGNSISEGVGMTPGLQSFLSPSSSGHRFLHLLEGQPESMPDLGLERSAQSNSSGTASAETRCYTCGRTRTEHPQRQFCPQPPPCDPLWWKIRWERETV